MSKATHQERRDQGRLSLRRTHHRLLLSGWGWGRLQPASTAAVRLLTSKVLIDQAVSGKPGQTFRHAPRQEAESSTCCQMS